VRQPSITPQVTNFTIPANAHIVFTSIAAGCSEKYVTTTNSSGQLTSPGFAYGTYKLCGDFSNNYAQLDSFVNSNPAGSSATLTVRGSGTCP
jgi:hypothetical protein